MVKRVLALLNIEVRSLIRAASITDSIMPFSPAHGRNWVTSGDTNEVR